jgi:hypothetical protein
MYYSLLQTKLYAVMQIWVSCFIEFLPCKLAFKEYRLVCLSWCCVCIHKDRAMKPEHGMERQSAHICQNLHRAKYVFCSSIPCSRLSMSTFTAVNIRCGQIQLDLLSHSIFGCSSQDIDGKKPSNCFCKTKTSLQNPNTC